MTKSNGLPCKKCGTSEWNKQGACKKCRRDYNLQWQRTNRDKMASSNYRYRHSNLDKEADRKRRYRQENFDRVADAKSQWAKSNPDKRTATEHRRRTRKTEAGGSYTVAEFKAMCDHYGNKCLRCGRTDVILTADHVKPVSKGGTSNIDNIQCLCRSCNSGKGDRHIDYRPDSGPLRWLQCKLFG